MFFIRLSCSLIFCVPLFICRQYMLADTDQLLFWLLVAFYLLIITRSSEKEEDTRGVHRYLQACIYFYLTKCNRAPCLMDLSVVNMSKILQKDKTFSNRAY